MYPAPFEYHAPQSAEEAVALLQRYEDEAKLLAGGHSLIPVLKLRFAQPKHLIDVRRIPGLAGVREADGRVIIGATTTHWMLESSELLNRRLPILTEAAALIGDAQVRNMGTIGGSLAHADPAADLPAVMLAVGAEMVALGPRGRRTIAADDFFVSLLTTTLAADELLTEVRIPLPTGRTGGAYQKYAHPASRYAVAGIAAMLTLDPQGAVSSARIGVTGLGPKAVRATAAEQSLMGSTPDAAAIERAARRVSEGIDVRADAVGPAPYKTQIATVYAGRALTRAAARARTAQ
jgi:carbon-monoxide dehydrogenase medium subunit